MEFAEIIKWHTLLFIWSKDKDLEKMTEDNIREIHLFHGFNMNDKKDIELLKEKYWLIYEYINYEDIEYKALKEMVTSLPSSALISQEWTIIDFAWWAYIFSKVLAEIEFYNKKKWLKI